MRGCRPLKAHECVEIYSNLKPRDQALFVLGVRTGLRAKELMSLQVKNVWQNGSVPTHLYIQRCNTKGQTCGASIPLHQQARAVIQHYITSLIMAGGGLPDDPLFKSRKSNKDGTPRALDERSVWRIINGAAKKVGMTGKIGTHSMRKTFAKKVYKSSGNDITVARKALRHSHLSTTMAYLDPDQGSVDSAITG